MPLPNLEVAAFITEPPEFTYENGLFHIRQRYGADCVIERVMPPNVFMLALKRAADAASLHFKSGAEVFSFAQAIAEKAARERH